MRKKSHISLAKFIVDNMQVTDLMEHKNAFYIGSILPDLKPSFITKKHTIDETFDTLTDEIKKITIDYDIDKGISTYYARHLGVITHYLADYFTFPHNKIFKGSISQHLRYEKELMDRLKEYITREDVRRERRTGKKNLSIEEIIQLIQRAHKEYLKALKAIKIDIQFIVDLCYRVVDALLLIFELAYAKLNGSNEAIEMQASQLI